MNSIEDINLKKVKALLAAGALTGILMATVVGLSVRNISRAVVVAPVPAQTTTLTTNNQNSGFFESEHHEQHGGGGFNDD